MSLSLQAGLQRDIDRHLSKERKLINLGRLLEGQASASRSGLGLRAIMIDSFNIFELILL